MKHPLKRSIFSHTTSEAKTTIVFTAGIHGNEPAGIYGLQNVADKIHSENIQLNCNVYAFSGNLNALAKNIRYEVEDLNRMWTQSQLKKLKTNNQINSVEEKEQKELLDAISYLLDKHKNTSFVFVDFHTTSADTDPFITISDSLNNRRLASKFSIPIVLGIEEYIEGPLLTYINEFGHLALGFEAGQHSTQASIDNCEAFAWLLLSKLKVISNHNLKTANFEDQLNNSQGLKGFFEINYRLELKPEDKFEITQYFLNFEKIKNGQPLAKYNGKTIKAQSNDRIFMPLYQKMGNDGFFVVNKISSFWIVLSLLLRKLRMHDVLMLLPGISKSPDNNYTLVVNPKIAKYLTTEVFHLFGYRKKIKHQNKLFFIRRDRKVTSLTHQ